MSSRWPARLLMALAVTSGLAGCSGTANDNPPPAPPAGPTASAGTTQ